MLKAGDIVVVEKPEKTWEFPSWIPFMDVLDGKSYEIEKVSNTRGTIVCTLHGVSGYCFKDSWLKLKKDEYWRV